MGTIYTFPETIKLVDIGVFTLTKISGIIAAGVTEPIKARLDVASGWRILTERFNFGMSTISIPEVLKYALYYDKGYYCGANVCQSNIDNVCTHLLAADLIEVWLYNIADYDMDVLYDFSVWYFWYPKVREPEVFDLLWVLSRNETEMMEKLREIHAAVVAGKIPGRTS